MPAATVGPKSPGCSPSGVPTVWPTGAPDHALRCAGSPGWKLCRLSRTRKQIWLQHQKMQRAKNELFARFAKANVGPNHPPTMSQAELPPRSVYRADELLRNPPGRSPAGSQLQNQHRYALRSKIKNKLR